MKSFNLFLLGICMFYITIHSQTKPNVLLIYTDDVGYGDVGFNGGKIPTPHLDLLASEGLTFTDIHTTSSTCTPSRFGMLTGEYPWRYPGTGIASPTRSLIIDVDMYTLPDMFKAAGYVTGVVGKWHLGIGPDGGANYAGDVTPGPLELGFDESFLIPSTGDRVPSVYVEGHRVVNANPADPITIGGREVLTLPQTQYPVGIDDPSSETYYNGDNQHSKTVINGVGRIGYMAGGQSALWNDEDMADDLVNRAGKFISDHKDKPFFLFFSTHDIHVPRMPHQRFQGVSGLSYRGDAMVQLDWCVGALKDSLKANGLDNKTMIIFSSDNGPVLDDGYDDFAVDSLGTHDPSGVYQGNKYNVFEAGTRVPGIVWWPGRVDPGVSNALMSQMDLLASFAHFLRVDVPQNSAKDSENHWSAFLGDTDQGKLVLVEQGTGNRRAIRLENNKLHLNQNNLYNLSVDVNESNNIYGSNTTLVDSMNTIYADIQAGTYNPPPAINVGCMDSNSPNYDDRANVNDPSACITSIYEKSSYLINRVEYSQLKKIIIVNLSSPYQLSIYDLVGKKILDFSGESPEIFNLNSAINQGLYFIKIRMGKSTSIKSFYKI